MINVLNELIFFFRQETNAVHVNVGAGSYLEINIPMTVEENGKLHRVSAVLNDSHNKLMVTGRTDGRSGLGGWVRKGEG